MALFAFVDELVYYYSASLTAIPRSSSVRLQPRSGDLRLSLCDARKFYSLVRHSSGTLSAHERFFVSRTVAAASGDARGQRLSLSVRSSRMIKGLLRLKAFAVKVL